MNERRDVQTLRRTFTQADFDRFAELSGDHNAIHVDPTFAAATRFGRPVAHGMLLYTILLALAQKLAPGAACDAQSLMFPAPTFAGDDMEFSATVASRSGGQTRLRLLCRRVADHTVTCEGTTLLGAGPGRL